MVVDGIIWICGTSSDSCCRPSLVLKWQSFLVSVPHFSVSLFFPYQIDSRWLVGNSITEDTASGSGVLYSIFLLRRLEGLINEIAEFSILLFLLSEFTLPELWRGVKVDALWLDASAIKKRGAISCPCQEFALTDIEKTCFQAQQPDKAPFCRTRQQSLMLLFFYVWMDRWSGTSRPFKLSSTHTHWYCGAFLQDRLRYQE